jgi:ABC-type multidrug transport system ATPase subunit
MRIALDRVTVQRTDGEPLRGVSFEWTQPGMLALYGGFKSGRESLLRVLVTAERRFAGKARVCGLDVRTHKHEVRKRIGALRRGGTLMPDLSAAENVRLAGYAHGMGGRALSERVADAMRIAEVPGSEVEVKNLPSQERWAAALAQAIVHRPQLLFTNVRPREAAMQVFERLMVEWELGIVWSMDSPALAERMGAVAMLVDGELRAYGSPSSLLATVEGLVVRVVLRRLSEHIRSLPPGARIVDGVAFFETRNPAALISALEAKFGADVLDVELREPHLEDVHRRLEVAI